MKSWTWWLWLIHLSVLGTIGSLFFGGSEATWGGLREWAAGVFAFAALFAIGLTAGCIEARARVKAASSLDSGEHA